MCVIIHRPANVEVPFAKLESACNVNPHGYGLVVSDRGKLETFKGLGPKGNDPDEVALLLEKAKGQEVFLHLRYQTSGKRDLANAHPFEVLSKAKDGTDVQFMHNGHLNDFTNSPDRCDSWIFAETVLRPLLLRSAAYDDVETILEQPFLATILKEFAGSSSVFLLAGEGGQVLKINENNGHKYDWGWASNDYSFQRQSRRDPPPKAKTVHKGASFLPVVANDGPKRTEAKDRETFFQIFDMEDISDVCSMSEETVLALCSEYPDAAAILILDLIDAVYTQKKTMGSH